MDDIDNAIDSVLGSEPAPAKEADPLDGAVDSVVNEGRQRLRQSVYGAVRSNPDQYAESRKLAGKTGIPADVIDRNFDEVSKRAKLNQYDSLIDGSPVLAERLQDNDFARLAHDDTETLSKLEQSLNKINERKAQKARHIDEQAKLYGEWKAPSQPLADFRSYLTGLKESFVQGGKQVSAGMKMQIQDLLNTVSPGDPVQEEVRRKNYVRQYLQAQDIQELSEPEFETATARGIYGGVSSFFRTVPGLAASVATRSPVPMLGLMGAETEAEAYGKYRARGATAGEALLGGVGEGATEVATELLPMGFLVKSLGKVGAGEFLKGILARELPTEQIATLVQDAIDTAVANPDKTWGDYAAERADAAYQTLIATLTQSAISGGINAAALKLSKQERQVNEAAAGAEALQEINQIATESKLRQRDPQSFATYIENLTKGGAMENIAIPVEQWNTYWQGAKADPRAMIAGIVGNTFQYDEAVHTGADIIIPTARYATQLAATEHAKALEKDIRFQSDELTPREAEILGEELKKASETVKEPTTADKVREDIVSQMVNIGQERSSAEAYASLHESFFKTLGAKAGIDAAKLYGSYGLKIDRPLPEVLQKDGKTAAIDVFLDRLRAGKLPTEGELKKEGGSSLYDMKVAMEQLGKTLESRGLDINVLDNATIRQELMKITAPEGKELFHTGTLEDFFTSKSAEKQGKAAEAGLVVAIKNGSKVHSGQPGMGYINLLMQHPELPNSAETGFTDKSGKFYTKEQAMEKFGVSLNESPSYTNEYGQGPKDDNRAAGTTGRTGEIVLGTVAGGNAPQGWSGATRIRGKDGKPLTVYRGASLALKSEHFGLSSLGAATGRPSSGLGVWFTVSEQEASSYGSVENFHLDIRNPLIVKVEDLPGFDTIEQAHTWREGVRKKGHDGIIVTARHLGGRVHIVAFDPKQAIYPPPDTSGIELDQPAYHGSPHDFDEFSLEHIGKGEGVQAYGWGLYFAENPAVAKDYQRQLSGTSQHARFYLNGEEIPDNTPERHGASLLSFNDAREIRAAAKRWLKEAEAGDLGAADTANRAGLSAPEYWSRLLDFVQKYKRKDIKVERGRLYQVDIPDEAVAKMLDWDKPLSEQRILSENLKGKLIVNGKDITEWPNGNGEQLYRQISMHLGSDKEASLFLNKNGIPGIKYLDQGSRGEGEGSRNIVVFDDKIINLTHKDGSPVTKKERDEFLQQKSGDRRGSIRFGNDRQFTINLFEKADLSTFLHESGHFFLEVFGDVAQDLQGKDQTELTASQQLVLKDYEALLKWLGVESRDQIKTEHHEKWARGFEAYLMEGKAPSAELRGAFAKFRAWLVSLYKAIRNLDVQLNDDVRRVMDRLLATEEEIDFAEKESELMPVFTDAESAGMTETEFALYRKTIEQASNAARETLQQQIMGDIRREQEKWWKDARKIMRAVVEEEVNKQPAYIAESVLRTGKMPDGSDLPEFMPAIKLSKQAIEDAYGKDVLGRLPRGTTAAEGVDMSAAAEILGYESGEKLLADLTTLQPKNKVIDAETDVRMRKEYGDMLLDGSAAVEAEKAVLGEGRGKVIAAEIKALKKKAAQVKPFVQAEKNKQTDQRRQGLAIISGSMATQEAMRSMAEGIVAQKKIRDIRPNDYAVALRQAAKQAVKLAAKDDYQGAVMEKQRELLNLELYRAANERLELIEKARKYLSKFDSGTKTKNLRGEFLEQIQELLSRFDLKKKTLKRVDQERLARTPLVQWINEEADRLAAVVPDIPGFILDESYRKNFKDMTGEEFEGLVDSVKQLEKLARRENEQYMAIRQMNFEQERAAILGRIKQFHPEAFDDEGAPKGQEPDFVPSISKASKKIGDKFAAEFLNPETILNLLEGGEFGQVEQSIFGRLSDRSNWKATRLEGIYKTLKPLFGQYSYKEKLEFSRKDIGTAIGIPMTRENAVVVSLLYGNAEGRERLMNYGWTDFQIQQIVGLLDKKDMDLVNGIWKLFDEDLWPELKALNERTKGKAPPKVQATSYPTKHGPASGGYFRLKYDTELDERAHKLDESQAVKEMLGGSLGMSAKTNQGTSKERKKGVKLRPRLDLGVFSETVNETVHDLAYREAVADTMRLLNDGEMQSAIKASSGTPAYRALVQRVREVAAPPRNPSGFIEKTISIARKNTVITLLSGLRTALLNLTGVIPAFTRVNTGTFLREIGKFYSPRMAEMYRFATENSEYMKHRFNNFDRDLQDMSKKMTVNGKILPDTAAFLWFMGMTDRGVTVPIWNAAFADGMKDHKNDVKMAVEYADHVVRQTQGSGREVDLSQIMSGHGGWGQLKKAFTMFYSYFNAQLGQLVRAGAISKKEAEENRALAVAKFTGRFMLIVAVPAALSTIGGRDDDDMTEKNWFKKLAQSTFLYMAGMVPLVRDLSAFAWSKFDKSTASFGFKISPIQSAGEGVVKGVAALKDIATGDGDEKDVKNLIMGTSYALGLPGKLISDVTLGTTAFLEGEADASAIFFGPPK